jgi:hypothetical protein
MNEQKFLNELQTLAEKQAGIEATSPLPEWSRPLASIVGNRYWIVLLIVSFIVAIPISVVFFATIYARVHGL